MRLILVLSILLMSQATASAATTYGIKPGTKAPPIATTDVNGKPYDLLGELKKGPVVLVFYRGGGVPIANCSCEI